MNSNIELNKNDSKRYSLEILQSKTKKFYQKYSLKENEDSLISNRNINNNINPSQLNEIEDNIKNALNNMIIKIEKTQAKSNKKEYLSPKMKRRKMMCIPIPELKFISTKKKNKI